MTAMDRSQPPVPSAEARACPPEAEGEGRRREALRRLRWRARRGLLENDLLLGRFLERQGEALEAADVEALSRLLDLPDNELLDLLLGRGQPAGELDSHAIRHVLARVGGGPSP
jgi:antitoxin CptB